jgi:hypothetical protein
METHMKDNEGSTVARGESGDGFEDTILSSRGFPARFSEDYIPSENINLRGVPSKEVVASLLRSELANRREDTESIAGQHNDIRGLTIGQARNLGVGNVLNRVRATSVFGNADIIVVGAAGDRVVDNVFENAAETDGVVDFWFLLGREIDAFSVATSFDVEDTSV